MAYNCSQSSANVIIAVSANPAAAGERRPDYRSISPSTMSMLPRIATESATKHPFIITGSALRLQKAGERTLYR
jgi:hypothetical protein